MKTEYTTIIQQLKKPAPMDDKSRLGQARTLVSAATRILNETTGGQHQATALETVCRNLKHQIEAMDFSGGNSLTIH